MASTKRTGSAKMTACQRPSRSRPRSRWASGCVNASRPAGLPWPTSTYASAVSSPMSTASSPTSNDSRCAGSAMAGRPAGGALPSTWPAATATRTPSCQPACTPAPLKKPWTAPAGCTSPTPPPGRISAHQPAPNHARTSIRQYLAIDLPNKDAPTPMNRVNKPVERSSLPRPQPNPVHCELLECLHGRFHWQRIVIIPIDQDTERTRKARSSELLAVSKRTTMAWVRRQDMHEHVVVRLAVIAHQAKHLYLNRPPSVTAWRNEKVALLPQAVWVPNASLHSTIQSRMLAPKLSE